MKNKIIQLLQSTAGMLIFALLSGCAYYIVVLKFILSHTSVGGGLLGFFFLPAIIFGAALVLIKIIKQCMENGNYNAVNLIFRLHIVFIIISAVFLILIFQANIFPLLPYPHECDVLPCSAPKPPVLLCTVQGLFYKVVHVHLCARLLLLVSISTTSEILIGKFSPSISSAMLK